MKCGKLQVWQNQTQAKQLVAAKVWLGKLWLKTKHAHSLKKSVFFPDVDFVGFLHRHQ
jgi:hypothetical protein